MTLLEGYLLSILVGGGWMAQVLLERNGKEEDAKAAKSVGCGAIFAIAVRLAQVLMELW